MDTETPGRWARREAYGQVLLTIFLLLFQRSDRMAFKICLVVLEWIDEIQYL